MNFAMIGVDYKSCLAQIREPLTFTSSQVIEYLKILRAQKISEVVLLSTCHRTEFYTTETEQIENIVQFILLIFQKNGGKGDIRPYLTIYKDESALKHLLNVTVGLESLVIGEDQILGQVKRAVELAREAETLGKVINKFFREAVHLSKKIKSQLKISEYPLSISHIAIQFLKEKRGCLKHSKGLLIGLGQMNVLTIPYLLEEEIETLYITNRTHGKTLEIETLYEGVQPIPYEKRYTVLNQVDFVISATASPHVVLKLEKLPELTHLVYFIDIAMPFDIDKDIKTLPLAQVYTIEDLKEIASRNQRIREQLSQIATIEIDKKIQELHHWLEQLEIEEVAKDLNHYCDVIKEHTSYVVKHQLHEAVSEDLVDYIMTETLKRCIRKPITYLRTLEDKDQRKREIEVLKALFDLPNKKG